MSQVISGITGNKSIWKSPNQLTPYFIASGIADEVGMCFKQV